MCFYYMLIKVKNLKKWLNSYYNFKKEYLKGRGSSKFYNAILKNNLNNFSLLILEFCDIKHLDEKENYYIKVVLKFIMTF